MRTWVRAAATALPLIACCSRLQAQPRLSDYDIRSLGTASVGIVYLDPRQPLIGYLDPANHSYGPGIIGMAVAGEVNERRLARFTERLQGYRTVLDGLPIADRLYAGLRDTLSRVDWLQKASWQRLPPDRRVRLLRQYVRQARTRVVVFLQPQLEMSVDARKLTLVCDVDIEVATPPGSYDIEHYSSYELAVSSDTAAGVHLPGKDDTAERLASVFTDGGAGLRGLLDALLPESEREAYHYFTGGVLPLPAESTAAAPAEATH